MTLHEYPNVIQGTEEWDALRRGMVTASVIKGLITPSTIKPANNPEARAIVALLVSERITGWTEPTFQSEDMWRGHEDEPFATETYASHYGTPVRPSGFMVRDDWGFSVGCSPDGLVGEDGMLEIKSRRPKKHLQTILADEVPAENLAQVQCGLLVSGRKWCDYLSYCGGMPMWRKRVEPDPRWHEAIVAAVQQFELAAAVMVATYEKATQGLPATERVDPFTVELKL